MDQKQRDELRDEIITRFDLPKNATYKEACRRVGEVLSEHLKAGVELKFVQMRNASLSGATVLHRDGTYSIYCVRSRSWYHRLGILLHELAHLVLEHQPVTLTPRDGLRHLAPHLPGKMARIIAGRTCHSQDEEREAEEFADGLLEQLTAGRQESDTGMSDRAPHVRRIAQELSLPEDRNAVTDQRNQPF